MISCKIENANTIHWMCEKSLYFDKCIDKGKNEIYFVILRGKIIL